MATRKIAWATSVPFWLIHLMPILAFWTGVNRVDWLVCFILYFARSFGITAGYHRYFSHNSYKMGRLTQFLMAWLGSCAAQKGVLWWAAHHVDHHKYSDHEGDPHNSKEGLWWSHLGWILSSDTKETKLKNVSKYAKYPELRWLNKYHLVPPTILALGCLCFGGLSMLLIGFFLSTVFLWHGTFSINSLAHIWGSRRYATTDSSRNNLFLALITGGEGWHNNHHYYMNSARQGFRWYEIDTSYYILKLMSWVGLVSQLNDKVPDEG